ncbi:hypothetical protein [Simiduia aestuariiviva]|uniref:Uncharacterized protein n=1 Tax=Simiduia aestuariiviva TaxID=1510459 RepID=A0A839UH20_9GAMM|nr:hypothetical protein [Simiduia aestuariiviva]MBB3167172.1 hypothetical protein [Simiduia aestuariiviva]
MDLVDRYIDEEADHIPLLVSYLRNEKGLYEGEFYSNLFNFKIDFSNGSVKIEDDAGLFYSGAEDRFQNIGVLELTQRLSDAAYKT